MWIKSQNKQTLENVSNLYIRAIRSGYQICSNKFNLACYSTKEKALKVLDDIENHIVMMEDNIVFIMPQDNEVK